MTPAQRSDLGLPGKTTDTALILKPGLTEHQIVHTLELIGRIGRASPWWAADALVYAEEHLPEGRFSQIAESLGWHPHRYTTAMWVARAWPRSRRREALSFGHHEVLAALEPEDQEHWAALAEAGDDQPNGEKHPWSVTTLRANLRALGSGKPTRSAPATTASASVMTPTTAAIVSAVPKTCPTCGREMP